MISHALPAPERSMAAWSIAISPGRVSTPSRCWCTDGPQAMKRNTVPTKTRMGPPGTGWPLSLVRRMNPVKPPARPAWERVLSSQHVAPPHPRADRDPRPHGLRHRFRGRPRRRRRAPHGSGDHRSARQDARGDRRRHARGHRRRGPRGRRRSDRARVGRRGARGSRRPRQEPRRRGPPRAAQEPSARHRQDLHRHGPRGRGVPDRRARGADPRHDEPVLRRRGLFWWSGGGCGPVGPGVCRPVRGDDLDVGGAASSPSPRGSRGRHTGPAALLARCHPDTLRAAGHSGAATARGVWMALHEWRWRWLGQGRRIRSEPEWRASADVFPIEYEDIRAAYRVLAGKDPWADIAVRRDDVRRQLEQELMGKLVRLRQAYAATRDDGKALTGVIAGSLGGFFTMLRATLRLAGRPAAAAATPVELLEQAAGAIGFPVESLRELATHAAGATRLALQPADPRAAAYLAAVAKTAEFVDHL